MSDDRDPMVARALRELPVPDHGPTFWSDLEARLAAEPAPERAPGSSGRPAEAPAHPGDEGADEVRLAPLVPLGDHRRSRSTAWMVSVAAVLVLVVAAVVTLARPQPEDERLRVADPSADDSAPVVPPTTAPSSVAMTAEVPVAGTATPDGAVVAWLEAVGSGDVGLAERLTGPRSKAYADALTGGAGVRGFLVEAGEGYGAWADSPDRSTTEVDLDVDGDPVTIVVVSGTWTGEGGTVFRTDAIPVVRTDGGTWLVEPWAIDPEAGGRLTVTSPTPVDEAGFSGLAADGVLSASAPGGGTFHFSLDDQPATPVSGQKANGGVRATFDPPGALSSRTHLFVVAYLDGPTISAVAGTFLVEG